jgi:8-oxo-dGTP pyrophosphatase MutT (NUDIX family)
VAITPALELVLVWQHRFGTDALSLEVPGGVIETGEAPDRAARRELREETGYEPRTLEPLIRVHPNPPLQSNVCYSFLAEGAHPNGPPAFDANEECELSLVPLASLRELLTEGHVTHALSVVALQALALRGI